LVTHVEAKSSPVRNALITYCAAKLLCRVLAHSSPTFCGMSRHSLRGSAHFGLLATVLKAFPRCE
jgi:hypothetical protein